MGALTSSLYSELRNLHWYSYYTSYLNDYFPFGSFWWMLGFIMCGVIHMKVKNFAYTAAFGALYFVGITLIPDLVTDFAARLTLRIFGVICGFVFGYYLYQLVIR